MVGIARGQGDRCKLIYYPLELNVYIYISVYRDMSMSNDDKFVFVMVCTHVQVIILNYI